MPKKSANTAEYVGAPPASEDGFAFVSGEFFADAAGQNRHRRATIAELEEKIASGTEKHHPAHWFEAQLAHYGLKPSKIKSVARMRLLDAVNAGDLAVPDHISKLEKKLKAAWNKSEREAKKKTANPAVGESTTTTTVSAKRKAAAPEETAPRGESPAGEPAAKKAKPTPFKTDEATPTPFKTDEATPTPFKTDEAKPTPFKTDEATPTPFKTDEATPTPFKTEEATPASPKPEQTARRGGIAAGGPSRSAPRLEEPPAMPRQMARRGGSRANGRTRVNGRYTPSSSTSQRGFTSNEIRTLTNQQDPPPPYSEVQEVWGLPPALGLLNGDYVLRSPCLTEQYPSLGAHFRLTITISGGQLWGRFDLGLFEGVMLFPERPWVSSNRSLPFVWRGSEDQGPIHFGNENYGQVRFLGEGVIEGEFEYQNIGFNGHRIRNQGMRSSISISRMEQEWDRYNAGLYESERRARWY